MTKNQILFQAYKKARSDYWWSIRNQHNPKCTGDDKHNNATAKALLTWNKYLEKHGLSPSEHPMPDVRLHYEKKGA